MTKQVVFFGSSPFSVPVLEKLLNAHCSVLSVVTTEDKPVGRHLKITPNPVKVLAQKYNIPVFETMNDYRMPMNDNGMTIGLVAAYGKIIPQEILDKFNGQIFNIHPSLLPKYRGPSPLQQQILDGVVDTGVTIIKMDSQMDHGPIVATIPDKILPDDTTITLGNRLFALGIDLIINSQFSIFNQIPISQCHNEATFTKKLTRQDGFVTEDDPKLSIKKRAYTPWPGVWTIDPEGKRIKLS